MANTRTRPFRSRVSLAWRTLTGQVLLTPRARRFSVDASLEDFFYEDATGAAKSKSWAGTQARDKAWPTRRDDLSSALAAWRTNPLARRIVNLTRDHVWGNGIRPTSTVKVVQRWLDRFWDHELNLMDERWPAWIDALTTDGEIFPTFHFNPVDGITLIRALAAEQVHALHWQPQDYEQLTEFGQYIPNQIELKWWPAVTVAKVTESSAWQYAVNRPVGALRGEGDLTPNLPWLAYYSDWLEDRVERNAVLTKFYYDITVEDANKVDDAKQRYNSPPGDGTAIVHSAGETHKVIQPAIGADDAKADGFAIKSMIAAGGNMPDFWLGDAGQGNTEATSRNMTDVSYRHYESRRTFVCRRIVHLCTLAYRRAADAGAVRRFLDPAISTRVDDLRPADNKQLAESAKTVADALATMIREGLDQDERLAGMIYKFAGEDLTQKEIADIVAKARARGATQPAPEKKEQTNEEDD